MSHATNTSSSCPDQPSPRYVHWMSSWHCDDGIKAKLGPFDCTWYSVDDSPKCPKIRLDRPLRVC